MSSVEIPSHTPRMSGCLEALPIITGTLGSMIIELRGASISEVVAPHPVMVLQTIVFVGIVPRTSPRCLPLLIIKICLFIVESNCVDGKESKFSIS